MQTWQTRTTEVAHDIHQFTTYLPAEDFSFNQYLIVGDEPFLFHLGGRGLFDSVLAALNRVIPVASLRWLSFGHVESDENGSMNDWLAAAPHATVVHGTTGCAVSLDDLADRPPRPLANGEVVDIGGHQIRWIDTPHVPHGWEAGVIYDESTKTLFCGDLFTRSGSYPAISDHDPLAAATATEDVMGYCSLAPWSAAICRQLSELPIEALAPMHAPVFIGDIKAALLGLADDFERRIGIAGREPYRPHSMPSDPAGGDG